MIGQKNLLNLLDRQIEKGLFPRFSILVGYRGSGKKTIASYIADSLRCYPTIVDDLGKANIKEVIDQSYKVLEKHVYIFVGCDDMSLAAKNSLLKVLEEPPNNAYFILTCENIDNMLPTIRSRGTVYPIEPYSFLELSEYASSVLKYEEDNLDTILALSDTPGDVKELVAMDFDEFYRFMQVVVDNIDQVSGANAFKIADRLSLKKDLEGYDLGLFFRAFRQLCIDNFKYHSKKFCQGVLITNKYANQLDIKSINRQSLFDMWLLDIRKSWMELGE